MAEKQIEIPRPDLRQIVVGVTGTTPLIVHRFGERALGLIEDKQQKRATLAKEARDPEAEFRDALYIMSEGGYGFPGAGVKKALVYAGGRFTDQQMTTLRGCINVTADLIEIIGSEPTMRSNPVRLNGGKVSSIAYRPAFWPWSMDIPITFNATMLSDAQVVNLVQIAGFAIGIGDWRPEKNGIFGQFVLSGEVRGDAQ